MRDIQPATVRSVRYAANTLREDPTCSKASQKKTTNTVMIAIARMRRRSSWLRGAGAAAVASLLAGGPPTPASRWSRLQTKKIRPTSIAAPAVAKP
jgi:hypothetical protein